MFDALNRFGFHVSSGEHRTGVTETSFSHSHVSGCDVRKCLTTFGQSRGQISCFTVTQRGKFYTLYTINRTTPANRKCIFLHFLEISLYVCVEQNKTKTHKNAANHWQLPSLATPTNQMVEVSVFFSFHRFRTFVCINVELFCGKNPSL